MNRHQRRAMKAKTHQQIDDLTGIQLFLHCGTCLSDCPDDLSPGEWSKTQTGVMPDGKVRVWCNRCNIPVCTLSLSAEDGERMAMLQSGGCACCETGHHHN